MHLQDAAPFCSLHTALDPQGDGTHGVNFSTGLWATINLKLSHLRTKYFLDFWIFYNE